MSTSRRCSIKEDHGGSITYWHCRRRSHPVQKMGGVCAMCLTERLSNIARCADPARPPQLTDQPSCGYPRLAGTHSQSVDSEGIAPNYLISMSKQGNMSGQQCDNYGMQEMSARDSSAGSEQSIACLIEREIDEGRQRYSDVTAGSKELALVESSTAPGVKQAQLARSRSYSTNSHFNSIQSTPPSCKSNSSLRNCGDSCPTSSNFRSYNTAAMGKSSDHALLTKSKSTGSNYNGNNRHAGRLRSPIHVWNLPNFWHKKCTHMERRQLDASSSHDHSSMIVQADDSVPFMKLPRSCSKNDGAANCMGIKWSNLRLFYLTHSSSTLGKGSGPSTRAIRRSSSSSCTQEPLTITQDVAASSSSLSARSTCSANLQVVDSRIAKGVSVCRRWRLPSFTIVSRKTDRYRASTIDYRPEWGLISAANHCSANGVPGMLDALSEDQVSGHKAALVSAHSQNGEEDAENECMNGTNIVVVDKTDIGGAIKINHRLTPSATSTYASLRNRGSGHVANRSSSLRSRVEPTLYMQPNIMNQCESIAALVSMDANLIHLV